MPVQTENTFMDVVQAIRGTAPSNYTDGMYAEIMHMFKIFLAGQGFTQTDAIGNLSQLVDYEETTGPGFSFLAIDQDPVVVYIKKIDGRSSTEPMWLDPLPGGGYRDAPHDGLIYGRQNSIWVETSAAGGGGGGGGLPEVPAANGSYVRKAVVDPVNGDTYTWQTFDQLLVEMGVRISSFTGYYSETTPYSKGNIVKFGPHLVESITNSNTGNLPLTLQGSTTPVESPSFSPTLISLAADSNKVFGYELTNITKNVFLHRAQLTNPTDIDHNHYHYNISVYDITDTTPARVTEVEYAVEQATSTKIGLPEPIGVMLCPGRKYVIEFDIKDSTNIPYKLSQVSGGTVPVFDGMTTTAYLAGSSIMSLPPRTPVVEEFGISLVAQSLNIDANWAYVYLMREHEMTIAPLTTTVPQLATSQDYGSVVMKFDDTTGTLIIKNNGEGI